MKKKLYWQNPEDRKLIQELLQKNEILITSTDTIYGFLANATQSAFEKIAKLKEVKQARPFLILISQKEMLNKVSHFADVSNLSEKTAQFIQACWPGPVTFIFKSKDDVLACLSSDIGTVALRCPEHDGLQDILCYFDGLFSTSANKSKETAPVLFEDILQDILQNISYVVCDVHEAVRVKSSTIVDLSAPNYGQTFPFTIIREGAFSAEKLKNIYKNL